MLHNTIIVLPILSTFSRFPTTTTVNLKQSLNIKYSIYEQPKPKPNRRQTPLKCRICEEEVWLKCIKSGKVYGICLYVSKFTIHYKNLQMFPSNLHLKQYEGCLSYLWLRQILRVTRVNLMSILQTFNVFRIESTWRS